MIKDKINARLQIGQYYMYDEYDLSLIEDISNKNNKYYKICKNLTKEDFFGNQEKRKLPVDFLICNVIHSYKIKEKGYNIDFGVYNSISKKYTPYIKINSDVCDCIKIRILDPVLENQSAEISKYIKQQRTQRRIDTLVSNYWKYTTNKSTSEGK